MGVIENRTKPDQNEKQKKCRIGNNLKYNQKNNKIKELNKNFQSKRNNWCIVECFFTNWQHWTGGNPTKPKHQIKMNGGEREKKRNQKSIIFF